MKQNKHLMILITCVSFLFCGCVADKLSKDAPDPGAAIKSSLPQLKSELEWAVFRNVAVPVPHEWHQFSQGSTFVSSVESVKEDGIFETGLTVQVIENVQKEYNAPASVAALSIFRDVKGDTDNKILRSSFEEKQGIKMFVFTYKNMPDVAKPVQVYKAIFANDKASSIDIVTFESPSDTWEKYWEKFGKRIMSKIILLNASS